MPSSRHSLTEPLLHTAFPMSTLCFRRVFVLPALLIGLSFAVFILCATSCTAITALAWGGQHETSAITMAWQLMRPSSSRQFSQPARAQQVVQPARVRQPPVSRQFMQLALGRKSVESDESTVGESAKPPEVVVMAPDDELPAEDDEDLVTEEADAMSDALSPEGPRPQQPRLNYTKGQITRWNHKKGFGFLRPNDRDEELFAHASCLMNAQSSLIREGDGVKFILEYNPVAGREQAGNIRLLPSAQNEEFEDEGKIISWDYEKDIGFIKPLTGRDHIFVHANDLAAGPGSVQKGTKVKFARRYNERTRKYQAARVTSILFSTSEASGMPAYTREYQQCFQRYKIELLRLGRENPELLDRIAIQEPERRPFPKLPTRPREFGFVD